MNRSRCIIALESTLTAHCLPSRFCSILIFGVLQGFRLLKVTALFAEKQRNECLHYYKKGKEKTRGLKLMTAPRFALTCRPYLAFICFSSFCRSDSLSSLVRAGPLENNSGKLRSVISHWERAQRLQQEQAHCCFMNLCKKKKKKKDIPLSVDVFHFK